MDFICDFSLAVFVTSHLKYSSDGKLSFHYYWLSGSWEASLPATESTTHCYYLKCKPAWQTQSSKCSLTLTSNIFIQNRLKKKKKRNVDRARYPSQVNTAWPFSTHNLVKYSLPDGHQPDWCRQVICEQVTRWTVWYGCNERCTAKAKLLSRPWCWLEGGSAWVMPGDDLSVVEEKIYGAESLFSVLCYADSKGKMLQQ